MNDSSRAAPAAETTRRRFLQWTGTAAASLACAATASAESTAAAPPATPDSRNALKLGITSYTFRHFSLEKTLAMTKRAGLKYVSLKDKHLPLNATPEQIAAAVKSVADAGLVLYGCGVITMHREAEVAQTFDYAKAAGMKLIIAMPSTEMLRAVEQKIKEYDIRLAIHNHGPEDKYFPTPESAYQKIKDLDRRLGLCIDIGHTVRAGADPARSIERFADRLMDFHMKDVTAATAKGQCIQSGRGVIDMPAVLRALVKIRYEGSVSFEYEIEESDPLPGLCESVGYTRGVLAAM
jgi:sugar phosphate isomerase/epimerase